MGSGKQLQFGGTGAYISGNETDIIIGGNSILLSNSNPYINFGSNSGTIGYGVRSNGGRMEFKHGAGTWAEIGSSGSSGDVSGPGSATDHAIVRFDTTTGKTLQDSSVLIDDANNVSGVNSLLLAVDSSASPDGSTTGLNTTGAITLGAGSDAGFYVAVSYTHLTLPTKA